MCVGLVRGSLSSLSSTFLGVANGVCVLEGGAPVLGALLLTRLSALLPLCWTARSLSLFRPCPPSPDPFPPAPN